MVVSLDATQVARPWPLLPSHQRWLDGQAAGLTAFAARSVRPEGGFGWLDHCGRLDRGQPVHTWITCRMTYVFALANLRGEPGAGPMVDHGLAALGGLLRDQRHGGWYDSVAESGDPGGHRKSAYPHAFVVLAAASATLAGRPGATELLAEALSVVQQRFWVESTGRTRESYAADWTEPEDYRGANSSMHMVEAFLAAADATGDPAWNQRALRIATHLVHEVATPRQWRLPEHFTAQWEPLPQYSAEHRADPFRPYGVTVGHQLEWARLLLHVESALADPPDWLLPGAIALFEAATSRGWAVDGADGFVYTLDWDDRPVVRARMHWVVAEAIAAAAALRERTGDGRYEAWYRAFWDYTRGFLVDPEYGSWHHELDADNRPASTVWRGKPDVYHAYQALLLPQVGLAPTLARAVIRDAGGRG